MKTTLGGRGGAPETGDTDPVAEASALAARPSTASRQIGPLMDRLLTLPSVAPVFVAHRPQNLHDFGDELGIRGLRVPGDVAAN